MSPRIFALWGGIAMIVIAIAAFFMPGPVAGLPPLAVEYSYGQFLSLVPMNLVSKVALLVLGLLGVYCANSSGVELPRSKWYSRLIFSVAAVLMVLGLIPETNTLFGYWPLFGGHVLASALVGLVAGFYSFALTSQVPSDRTGKHMTRESLVH